MAIKEIVYEGVGWAMPGSCKHGIEHSGSIIGTQFLNSLSENKFTCVR